MTTKYPLGERCSPTKSETAKKLIKRIMDQNELDIHLEKARKESGLAVHPFYSILKEMLVDLAEPDTTMDELRKEFELANTDRDLVTELSNRGEFFAEIDFGYE